MRLFTPPLSMWTVQRPAVCTQLRRPLVCVAMGGQGARRARNWRHNRPNSPYNKSRVLTALFTGTSQGEQEQQLLSQVRELTSPPPGCYVPSSGSFLHPCLPVACIQDGVGRSSSARCMHAHSPCAQGQALAHHLLSGPHGCGWLAP
jgi:hypothetical protein